MSGNTFLAQAWGRGGGIDQALATKTCHKNNLNFARPLYGGGFRTKCLQQKMIDMLATWNDCSNLSIGCLIACNQLSQSRPEQQFTHYSLLTTHYSLLSTHYSILTTHYSLLPTHYSVLTTHYSLLTTRYSLLTAHCSPLTIHYSLLTTHYSLLITHQ